MGAPAARRKTLPSSGAIPVNDRIKVGVDAVRDIVGKVWLWVIVGIAVGYLFNAVFG